MRVWLTLVAIFTITFGAAQSTLVIHPFDDGGDYTVGTVVADAVAAVFSTPDNVVFGPETAPSVLPPVWVPSGFVSLTRLLRDEHMFTITGAQLLQGALQADVAVTGSLDIGETDLTLTMHIAVPGGTKTRALTVDVGDYDRLVGFAIATIAGHHITYDPHLRYTLNDGLDQVPFTELLFALTNGDYQGARHAAAELPEITHYALHARASQLAAAVYELPSDADLSTVWRHLVLAISAGTTADADLAEQFLTLDSDLATLWAALLYLSDNQHARATRLLTRMDVNYPFARQIARNVMFHQSDRTVDAPTLLDWYGPLGQLDMAGAFVTSAIAFDIGTPGFEAAAAEVLMRTAPFLPWGFEQRSFAAFDLDDPKTAAVVLSVAVELEPDSALFWTNLGWARYLLNDFAGSIAASRTATELPAVTEVPFYNLGLAYAVQNEVELAYEAYMSGLDHHPEVNEAALEDLLNVAEPTASVTFFTAFLAQEDGNRALAQEHFERFAALELSGNEWHPFQSYADERLVAYAAPPAELVIEPSFALHLGVFGSETTEFHAGDAVATVFELTTPGFELPRTVTVAVDIAYEGGVVYDVSYPGTLSIPEGAVGYVIDELSFTLDPSLPVGEYEVTLIVAGDQGQEARMQRTFHIVGKPNVHRVLFSHNVQLLGVETGRILNTETAINTPDTLMRRYLEEIGLVAEEAANVIPELAHGRFAGLNGREAFAQVTADDVQDFLNWVVHSGEFYDFQAMFVDLFAEWVMIGTP